MLKYKLNDFYNIADYNSDYVENYLRAIGIENTTSFLDKPQEEDELSPWLLDNMERAINMLKKHIDNKNKIFLIVD